MNGDIPLSDNKEDALTENDSIQLENELRDNTIADSMIYEEKSLNNSLNNNGNVESLPYELTAQMSSISEEMLVFDNVDLNQENSIIAISNQEVIEPCADKIHYFTEQFDNMEMRLVKAKNCYIKSKEYLEQGNLSLAIAEMEKCLANYSSLEDGASYLASLKQLEHDENKRISENLLNKGKEYFEKHNIDMALNLWNEAWQTFPLPELKTLIEKVNNILTTALEYYEKAQLLDNSNQLEEALEAIQECLKLNPDHRNAMLLQEVLKAKINMKNDLLLHNTQKRLEKDIVLKKLEEDKNIEEQENKKEEELQDNIEEQNNNEEQEELQDNNQKQEELQENHEEQEELEELQDNIQEQEQESNEENKEQEKIEELQEELEELQDNIQENHEEQEQEKIEELQEELEELQDNIQEQEQESNEENKEQEKIEELQEKLEELQDNIQEQESNEENKEQEKIEELQEELEELQDNIQEQESNEENKEQEKIEELQEELEELQDNIQEQEQENHKEQEQEKIEELQEELEELQDNIQEQESNEENKEQEKIEELQEELQELQDNIEKNEEADSEEKEKMNQDNLNDLIDSLDENCEDEVENIAGTNEIDPLEDNDEDLEDLFTTQANTKVPKIFLTELEDDNLSPKLNDLLSRTTSRLDRDMIISEQERMKLLSQIPIEEKKQKERLTETKRKNNHLLQQAQIAYKSRQYDQSLEIVEKLLSQSHEAEPELLAETQKLYTALMKHANSQKAIYILEEIEYSLTQFDIEHIDFLFSNEVFKTELDRLTTNRRDMIFKKTVEIANLRTKTRYYILIIFTILLSIIQLLQFIY